MLCVALAGGGQLVLHWIEIVILLTVGFVVVSNSANFPIVWLTM